MFANFMKMAAQLWLPDESPCQSQTDDGQDLFVFGYACKIFRNDEKALYVDQGRHLIPWMGDDSLMIDRYDGRGHLYDLSKFDADIVDTKKLSLEEEKLEKICDEERYLELNTDIAEKTVYEEEEWKRYQEAIQAGYNAVGFSYEQPQTSKDIYMYHQDEQQSEEEKPFTPPSHLNFPSDLILPTTNRINAVIEKTANFIAEHGTQMEIVLKAKQALNSQFDFLDYNNTLNSYYKFMVKVIKSGKYVPKNELTELPTPESQEDNEPHDHHEHGYLHKSLACKIQPSKSVKMPVVSINDTPYGQLVQSIRKHHKEETEPEPSANLDPSIPSYVLHHQEQQHHQNDQQNLCSQKFLRKVKGHKLSNQASSVITEQPCVEMHQLHQGEKSLSVSNQPNPIIPPPPDIQPIIDRMALYVAKNGSEFEMVVQSKNDVRFQFLNDWHVHYKYYDFKKTMHHQILLNEMKEKEETQAALLNRSVSFSIKTRNKESEPVTQLKKPLFDYGSSDDNNETDSEKNVSSSSTPCSSDQTSNKLEDGNVHQNDIFLNESKKSVEGRLMNKLATAARDKLSQTSKEKQMQAERKRKAAMFISLLKGKSEQNTDNGNQASKVIINRGYGQKDEERSSKSCNALKIVTPPLLKKSTSRSPSNHITLPSRHSITSRISPKRRSRTPRNSPKRNRSPTRHWSQSARRLTDVMENSFSHSRYDKASHFKLSCSRDERASHSRDDRSSRSRDDRSSRSRDDRSSRSGDDRSSHSRNDRSSRSGNDRFSHSRDDRWSCSRDNRFSRSRDGKSLHSEDDKSSRFTDEKSSHSGYKKSSNHHKKKTSSIKKSDSDNQSDLIELTHLTNIVIKKEKNDPGFDKALSSSGSLVPSENSKCSENKTNETSENNSVTSDKQEEEDDDDVEILEVPLVPVEPVELVDLTYISSDSDTNKKQKSPKKHDRQRKKSRSPSLSRKKWRPSRSKGRRTSSSSRRRKSWSLSSTKGHHSSSSNYSKDKHYERRNSKSRSKSPKRKKDRCLSPKHIKATSKSPVTKNSRRDRSRSLDEKQSKTPKKKKVKSHSESVNRKRSQSKSVSPRRKESKVRKRHKSPSRSPRSHKKKKRKEKSSKMVLEVFEINTAPSSEKEIDDSKITFDESINGQINLSQSNEDSLDALDSESSNLFPPSNLLNKVRAMLKASRDVIKSDDETR